MRNHQFIIAILLCIFLSHCGGGTRTYVDYSRPDSNPYWTGSLFEKAYVQFHNENYDRAKALFIEHIDTDSLASDHEAYPFLAECYTRLGKSDSAKIVYSEALSFLNTLMHRKPEQERFKTIYDQVSNWYAQYPVFPNELLEKNGFVPFNVPPEPKGGWAVIARNLKYPEIARKGGIEGRVQVKTLINEEGEATEFEIFKSLHPACDEAAISALRKVRFKPAKLKGKVCKVWVVLPVQFRLR